MVWLVKGVTKPLNKNKSYLFPLKRFTQMPMVILVLVQPPSHFFIKIAHNFHSIWVHAMPFKLMFEGWYKFLWDYHLINGSLMLVSITKVTFSTNNQLFIATSLLWRGAQTPSQSLLEAYSQNLKFFFKISLNSCWGQMAIVVFPSPLSHIVEMLGSYCGDMHVTCKHLSLFPTSYLYF